MFSSMEYRSKAELVGLAAGLVSILAFYPTFRDGMRRQQKDGDGDDADVRPPLPMYFLVTYLVSAILWWMYHRMLGNKSAEYYSAISIVLLITTLIVSQSQRAQ
jgi:hypothetical protein